MIAFQEYLTKRGLLCTIRESKGLDISAACGQLREQESENNSKGA
jgi:23S rRNA (adenine2503-C2)-methyltransferase